MDKIKLLLLLGWKDYGYNSFSRREFSLGDYCLFEYQGKIGIVTEDYDFIYCDLTEEEIRKYTELINNVIEIDNNEESCTLYDYRLAKEKLDNYYKVLIEK